MHIPITGSWARPFTSVTKLSKPNGKEYLNGADNSLAQGGSTAAHYKQLKIPYKKWQSRKFLTSSVILYSNALADKCIFMILLLRDAYYLFRYVTWYTDYNFIPTPFNGMIQ